MAEPKEPREPRIPKESPPFDADNKWTRTWIMYFESLFSLSVKEAVRQTLEVAVTHSGDLTKDLPVFGADAAVIKVGTKSGNTNKVVTNTGTNVTGNTVKWDANGNLIDAGVTPGGGGGGGSGTVTSVALTVPAEFSVSGSPVTTSGTLAVTKATQSANLVYAGPTTGSAAAPTFRAVVPADLPLASSSAFGAVKVDGTTITASSGVISAAGGSSGALILLEQHTANNTSVNMDFTAFISGSYDEYVIELLNVVPATNNIIISIRMSVGGTFDTGSNYSAVGSFLFSGSTGVGTAEDTATQIKLWDGVSNSASYGFCGSYRLFSPGSSSLYKVLFGQGFAFSGSAAKIFGSNAWGVYRSASAVDGIRVFSSSGNLTSGIVRVYGIAK